MAVGDESWNDESWRDPAVLAALWRASIPALTPGAADADVAAPGGPVARLSAVPEVPVELVEAPDSRDGQADPTGPHLDRPTQTLLLDRLKHALARSERSGSAVVVISLRFEIAGQDELQTAVHIDRVLLAASRRLRAALRTTDTVARVGDDGFTLICERIADSRVQTVTDRVIEAVRMPFDIDGLRVPVIVRSGVAVGRPPLASSYELLEEAHNSVR